MTQAEPMRGEIWNCALDPTTGHEQKGTRPVLIVSADRFNISTAGLVVAVPLTGTDRNMPVRVKVEAPDGGVRKTSFAIPEQVRCVSKHRLSKRFGKVSAQTMRKVEDSLRIILDL